MPTYCDKCNREVPSFALYDTVRDRMGRIGYVVAIVDGTISTLVPVENLVIDFFPYELTFLRHLGQQLGL